MKINLKIALIFKVFEAIDKIQPKFILIENVPRFLNLYYPYNGKLLNAIDLLEIGSQYTIDYRILNSMNYGIPQSRKRSFIKVYKKGLSWKWPKESEDVKTVRDAIGHLPSIESENSQNLNFILDENTHQIMFYG